MKWLCLEIKKCLSLDFPDIIQIFEIKRRSSQGMNVILTFRKSKQDEGKFHGLGNVFTKLFKKHSKYFLKYF